MTPTGKARPTSHAPRPPTGEELGLVSEYTGKAAVVQDLGYDGDLAWAELRSFLPDTATTYRPYIHSTNMKTRQECERRFFFGERLGLRHAGEHVASFHRGTVFHMAAACLLDGQPQDQVIRAIYAFAKLRCTELKASADQFGILKDGMPWEKAAEQLMEGAEKALAMALIFLKKYPPNLQRYEVLGVEVPVVFKLKGVPRPIKATLDVVLRERKTGWIVFEDHKTTSKPPIDLAHALKFDFQPLLYRLAAMAKYPTVPIKGCVHNIIKVPSIKYCPSTKDKAGYQHYIGRVEDWFTEQEARYDAGDLNANPLIRSSIRFSRTNLPADFLEQIKRTSRLANCKPLLARFPRCGNNYVCTGGAFGTPCAYLSLCATDNLEEWRQQLQSGYFIQRHRDQPEEPDDG